MSVDTRPVTVPSASATPMERLMALHRAGALADRYAEVRALLTELTGTDLVRAGHLLSRVDPADVLRAHPTTPTLTVAVTGHGTVSSVVPALTAELARHGLLIRPWVAEFDSYVFDLGEPGSALYQASPDLVLCLLDPAMVLGEVPLPWTPADVAAAFDARLRVLAGLCERFAATGSGTLVLNTLPLTRTATAQLVDHRSRAELGALWREANARLLRLAAEHPSIVVIDLDPLIAEGIPASDARLAVYAKAHLHPDLLNRYAREAGHLARHLAGRTRKALVLDLDNTVWGGIVGEDGVDGIEVAETYRGEAFRAFQRVVKQLGSQGVLVAAVSKNDPEPVRAALTEHPEMTLREGDFVRVIANWRPKHDNLTELASALNLNVDSFVFVDDSGYECGLIRHALPDVAVVPVDTEPALHVEKLLADGWFDVRELTSADRTRVATYRDELVRKDFLDSFSSVEDYLHALGVRVRLGAMTEAELPRVSQLTLRTNQFNLTTRRLQPAQLREFADAPGALVLTIHAADRFGENGLVGAILTRRDGDRLHLDNFLLSCRVFSRGIEQACLLAVLRWARDTGAAEVVGHFRPTAKNGIVGTLYPRYGFAELPPTATGPGQDAGPAGHDGGPVSPSEDGETWFRHDLTGIGDPPAWVDLTESFRGDPQ